MLERIPVTKEMLDLIRRQTAWIAKDLIAFNRPIKTALENAYIQGMNDAISAYAYRASKDKP